MSTTQWAIYHKKKKKLVSITPPLARGRKWVTINLIPFFFFRREFDSGSLSLNDFSSSGFNCISSLFYVTRSVEENWALLFAYTCLREIDTRTHYLYYLHLCFVLYFIDPAWMNYLNTSIILLVHVVSNTIFFSTIYLCSIIRYEKNTCKIPIIFPHLLIPLASRMSE